MEITDSEPPAQGFFFYYEYQVFVCHQRESSPNNPSCGLKKKNSTVRFLKYISLKAIQKVNGEEDEESSHICWGVGGQLHEASAGSC